MSRVRAAFTGLTVAGALAGPVPAQAEFNPEAFAAGGALAPATGGALANASIHSGDVVGKDGVTYPGQFVDDCVNDGLNVASFDARSTTNPAQTLVGMKYIKRDGKWNTLRIEADAWAVGEDCDQVLDDRTIEVRQRYLGKQNIKTKGSKVTFTGLSAIDAIRKVPVKRPYGCVNGKAPSYTESVVVSTQVHNGAKYTLRGTQVFPAASDNC